MTNLQQIAFENPFLNTSEADQPHFGHAYERDGVTWRFRLTIQYFCWGACCWMATAERYLGVYQFGETPIPVEGWRESDKEFARSWLRSMMGSVGELDKEVWSYGDRHIILDRQLTEKEQETCNQLLDHRQTGGDS